MKDNTALGNFFFIKMFRQVDNSSLIVFRILFGLLLFYHVMAYLLSGTVYLNFIEPPFTFNYIGFDFLQPLPGNGMYYYLCLMGLAAIFIMLGAWYRIAMAVFAILWTILYLMQKSGYNNHYYLILLLCWLMVIVPANGNHSLDVKRKSIPITQVCPQWVIWIFSVQFSIVYFFAAISKLNNDWFSGKFLAIQFSRLSMHRVYGIIYNKIWFPQFIAYTGFFFDLLIVPLLLWKKTRYVAFFISCLFHLFNLFSFKIGIFPFLSIALTLFFIEPEKIRSIFFKNKPGISYIEHPATGYTYSKKILTGFLLLYFIVQIIVPMRSWFFPGNVFWTEEGYRLSWKMMLRTKSGSIYFKVRDPVSGEIWIEDPKRKFSPGHVMWIANCPDISWQYAQRLKNEYTRKGFPNVEVYAIGSVSLNRAKPLPIIDTTVNLSNTGWDPFHHSYWITENNLPEKK